MEKRKRVRERKRMVVMASVALSTIVSIRCFVERQHLFCSHFVSSAVKQIAVTMPEIDFVLLKTNRY